MKKTKTPNTQWQEFSVTPNERSKKTQHKPCVVWFTGYSGAGKSAMANALDELLFSQGMSTSLLDGDNLRHGLCGDLGFSDSDRFENIRRAAEVAKLMADAGLIVLASFISPLSKQRELARGIVQPVEFVEVFVNTPLSVCEQRDPKGLYKKARDKTLKDFTGIDSSYEPPLNPSLSLDGAVLSVDQAAVEILQYLYGLGVCKR